MITQPDRISSAKDQFLEIQKGCESVSKKDQSKLDEVSAGVDQLQAEIKMLAYFALVYFFFLLLFLVVFDFCKVDQKGKVPENVKKNQFKCRQICKVLLQIGFVVLIVKLILTVKKNKELVDEIEDIKCEELQTKISETIELFGTQIYVEAMINLVLFVFSICLDYNCLLFPHVRAHYFLYQAEGSTLPYILYKRLRYRDKKTKE